MTGLCVAYGEASCLLADLQRIKKKLQEIFRFVTEGEDCAQAYVPDDFLMVLYCTVEGSRLLMPLDALQPKAYCTDPGL